MHQTGIYWSSLRLLVAVFCKFYNIYFLILLIFRSFAERERADAFNCAVSFFAGLTISVIRAAFLCAWAVFLKFHGKSS